MEKVYNRIRNYLHVPKRSEIDLAFSTFSEKEWVLFGGLLLVLILSTVLLVDSVNQHFMSKVPLSGGSISEGIIGTPRFINPILANSPVDQDLVALIYSGLMRKSNDGKLIPDLGEKYEVSKDNLTYTFTLKNNLYFSDGEPLTADDVEFTINKIKDSVIKSPHKVDWDGVTVEKVDEKTIRFTLRQPYPSFLENTTLGIMPAHIWGNSPIELNSANTSPVGSGPYQIASVKKQTSGIIEYYELSAFKKFILHAPYIKTIDLYFYPNESDLVTALLNGTVDQISSISPANTKALEEKGYNVVSSVLPRVFGLFFNQSQNQLFIDKTVIKAIDQAIDKDKIIEEVLAGYGTAIDDPIPPNMTAYHTRKEEKTSSREEILEKVQASLAKAGWVKGADGFLQKTTTEKKKKTTKILEFSISTSNAPELAKTALLIQSDLALIGMKVDIKTFEIGNLNQGVIRPRKYDALLFGEIINRESDLYAFWHSSQRKDPGLNVAMYTNAKVDKILEDAFVTTDEAARIKKYTQFEDEIKKDMPAVFLYSPDFIYVTSKNIQGLSIDPIAVARDRFRAVYSWYIQTENVWNIFTN